MSRFDASSDAVGETADLLSSRETVVYGVVGIVTTALVYLRTGLGTDNLLLLAIGTLFLAVYASGFAWFLWRFLLPMMTKRTT